MSIYQKLMEETYLAKEKFDAEWKKWRKIKLKRTMPKKEKRRIREIEPESVTNARNEFLQKLDELYILAITPLEIKFRDDPHSAMSEMLEFLSIDITAFRCGYAKEEFIELLKKVKLRSNEIKEVQRVALQVCETENIRREFRRWCRLMNKIADENFVLELLRLLESENKYVHLKAKWTLEMIYRNKTDLREFITF